MAIDESLAQEVLRELRRVTDRMHDGDRRMDVQDVGLTELRHDFADTRNEVRQMRAELQEHTRSIEATVQTTTARIEGKVDMTNGRVRKLEIWQARIDGAKAAVGWVPPLITAIVAAGAGAVLTELAAHLIH